MMQDANPIASARPSGVHQNSVAAENPHRETKLSSARGLTQEREGRTLADASERGRKRET